MVVILLLIVSFTTVTLKFIPMVRKITLQFHMLEIRSIGGEVRSLSCRRRVVACREIDRCIVWEMLMSMVPYNIFINALVPFLWHMLLETDGAVPRFLVSRVFCGRSADRVCTRMSRVCESYTCMYIYIAKYPHKYVDFCLYDIHQNRYLSYIYIYMLSHVGKFRI